MAEPTQGPEVSLERIYLKDASFESPRSPEVLVSGLKPKVHLDINTRSKPLEGNRMEVVLSVTATLAQEDITALIIEVQQAGVFRVLGLPEDQTKRVLGTFCPNLLFPYIRETVDSLALKGGFPPLNLAPINFDALFERAAQENARKQQTPSSFN